MEPRDLSKNKKYTPGRGGLNVAKEMGLEVSDVINLASNENPIGPSDCAVEAIKIEVKSVSRYPKNAHGELVKSIAKKWKLKDEQVWLSNGGDGAIDYISRAMLKPKDSILVPNPGFAYYGMSAIFHHGYVNEYNILKEDDFKFSSKNILDKYDGQRIIYLTSPHNPTGGEISIEEIEIIADETDENSLIVVDEAYGEYSKERSAVELFKDRNNVAIIRTFSKAYGLAGCRVGYAMVPEEWSWCYAHVNTPFAVGELSCHAAMAALGDLNHTEKTVELAMWARNYMRENIKSKTWESQGNFVLVEVGNATKVSTHLKSKGIIVRDCTSFGIPDCIRITCGTEEQTRKVVEELNDIIK
jgi:histidinol-phosphate aminotransferase